MFETDEQIRQDEKRALEALGIPNYVPEKLEQRTISGVTSADIIEAIKACIAISPLIKPSETLINSVFQILKELFIEDKKYVILEAPTGSGKTIIGFMTFFCVQYIYNKKEFFVESSATTPIIHREVPQLTYFLTSAKLLQEQIDSDLDRFDFRNFIFMLKGTDNYDCISETEKLTPNSQDKYGNKITRVSYVDRPCKGLDKKARLNQFGKCDPICPYQNARFEASEKACTVLNYAYFLNVMRADFNPFFGERFKTIADEAHLIPDIVCNIFNYEFTQFIFNQAFKLVQELEINFGSTDLTEKAKTFCMDGFKIFSTPLYKPSDLINYYKLIEELKSNFESLIKSKKYEHYSTMLQLNGERFVEALQGQERFLELANLRPKDIFYESELVANDKLSNSSVHKHIVKDLSESAMVKEYFLKKINKGVFMSATLGDIDEYATMMGMEKHEYSGLRLKSNFDFSNSPIFLVNSAWLNYANFEKNIDKVLMDTLKICNERHPKEKGIIHTATFKIGQLLREKVEMGLVPNPDRFLFYQNATEKEKLVELLKTSTKPYIIVGPSLYEGLDLKDDLGRFNILIKVPYAAMTDYIKKKIERFPFWYERNTLEKIGQAIGRTNRHINDYSSVYVMDACFEKMIWKMGESITSRIRNLRL